VNNLVAIDLPQTQDLLKLIASIWDDGDAIYFIDQRFSDKLKQQAIDSVRPKYLINLEGKCELNNSIEVCHGDALIISTSGTTGKPKALIHTFDSLKSHSRLVNEYLKINSQKDKWIACLPLNHIGGLGVVLRSMFENFEVAILEKPDPKRINDLNREGFNLISLVITILSKIDISHFKAVVLGGMAEPEKTQDNVFATYGLTETGGGVVYNGQTLNKVSIRIDKDSSLISVKTPTLFRGYRSLFNETLHVYEISAQGIEPELTDGYFQTSDCGFFDNDRLKILGRTDDVINTGGEKIWPGTIESEISAIEGIIEVAVVPVADVKWGHKIVAAITKQPQSKITVTEIANVIRDSLSDWAVPKEIKFVQELPKTSIGKIDKQAVIEMFK
jgi:O-succinylbenzoic acid--CoA ligase